MITGKQIIAAALTHEFVLLKLGRALLDDLVTPNPFDRRIVKQAIAVEGRLHRVPSAHDWALWLDTLDAGWSRDHAKADLDRLLGTDTSEYTPEQVVEAARKVLLDGVAQVARARLNEQPQVTREFFQELAQRIETLHSLVTVGRPTLFPTLGDLFREHRAAQARHKVEA